MRSIPREGAGAASLNLALNHEPRCRLHPSLTIPGPSPGHALRPPVFLGRGEWALSSRNPSAIVPRADAGRLATRFLFCQPPQSFMSLTRTDIAPAPLAAIAAERIPWLALAIGLPVWAELVYKLR